MGGNRGERLIVHHQHCEGVCHDTRARGTLWRRMFIVLCSQELGTLNVFVFIGVGHIDRVCFSMALGK